MFAKLYSVPVRVVGVLAAVLLCLAAAPPAQAQTCQPYICYVDLGPSPSFICPNSAVYPPAGRRSDPIVNTSVNPGCDVNFWKAAVVQVNVPPECSGVTVWVEYAGAPEGFSVNIGDSETNDGFAGDAGSLPIGQNAELQVLHENLTVYSNATAPPVDTLAVQHLALNDGALKFVVKNQSVSWGNPYAVLATPSLQKLFFLPTDGSGNRTIYVGLNRTISPVNGQNTFRNGCGARHAIMFVQ
ncbi:MAG: hypothetical protein QOH06_1002 [Acidobacteriota bacterium]|jgi:hypothetical protein|nr:hypothetical protein [Acidobacteriota bacterium]